VLDGILDFVTQVTFHSLRRLGRYIESSSDIEQMLVLTVLHIALPLFNITDLLSFVVEFIAKSIFHPDF
jgi:hypothetical protein